MSKFSEEQLKKYLHSRVIYSESSDSNICAIIVDGFRFVRDHHQYLLSRRLSTSVPSLSNKTEISFHSPGSSSLRPECRSEPRIYYFLSHYHSDHYTGLSSSWSHGRIFCSVSTAAALTHSLGIAKEYIQPLEEGKIYQGQLFISLSSPSLLELTLLRDDEKECPITSSFSERCKEDKDPYSMLWSAPSSSYFSVCLLPANHCPGAVMFLFYSPSFGHIVHTGDFRFDPERKGKPLTPSFSLQSRITGGDGAADDKTAMTLNTKPESGEKEAPKLITDQDGVNAIESGFNHSALSLQRKKKLERVCSMAREEKAVVENPYMRAACGNVRTLFLDNTYCAPCFEFPPQQDAAKAVIEKGAELLWESFLRDIQMRARSSEEQLEMGLSPSPILSFRLAILVGSYTIGKERVALDLLELLSSLLNKGTSVQGEESGGIWASPNKVDLFRAMLVFENSFRSWGQECLTKDSLRALSTSSSSNCEDNVSFTSAKLPKDSDEFPESMHRVADEEKVRVISTVPTIRVPFLPFLQCSSKVMEKVNDFFSFSSSSSSTSDKENAKEMLHRTTVDVTLFLVPMAATAFTALREALLYCDLCFVGKSETNEGGIGELIEKSFTSSDTSSGLFSDRRKFALLNFQKGDYLDLSAFHSVIAVEPTGWAKKKKTSVVFSNLRWTSLQRSFRGWNRPFAVVRISFPYSEHTSFSKLIDFVRFINPERVVPTVDTMLFKKHEALFMEKASRLRSSFGSVPISRFFSVEADKGTSNTATFDHETIPPSLSNGSSEIHDVSADGTAHRFIGMVSSTTALTPLIVSRVVEVEEIKKEEDLSSSFVKKNSRTGDSVSLVAKNGRLLEAFPVSGIETFPKRCAANTSHCTEAGVIPSVRGIEVNPISRKREHCSLSVEKSQLSFNRGMPFHKHTSVSGNAFSRSISSSTPNCDSDCIFIGIKDAITVISSDDEED